ncbi:MAG: hypothetical protein NZ750_04845 [Anaerolineae bacterium]|nr:hypothetical protein [Anaerolineae bacterium]MDW8173787.1 hypothetical protein [Anaerolineae bacterium]
MDKHYFIVQWLAGRYHARSVSAELAQSIGFFSLSIGHVHCPRSGDWYFYFVNERLRPAQANYIAYELFSSGTCCPQHGTRHLINPN